MTEIRKIAGFPYFPVQFTKEGGVFDQSGQVDAGIRAFLGSSEDQAITDLLVLSHGWNNNMAEAECLYTKLLTNLEPAIGAEKSRQIAVIGILWPSKRFTDSSLIPGGGAASFSGDDQPTESELSEQIQILKDAYVDSEQAISGLKAAEAALPEIDGESAAAIEARDRFLSGLRSALNTETGVSGGDLDGTDAFLTLTPEDIFTRLQTHPSDDLEDDTPIDPNSGGATGGIGTGMSSIGVRVGDEVGGAQGLGDIVGKFRTAAEIVLNLTTYYTMKGRAGTVGRGGAFSMLQQIATDHPNLRLHLVGHSFGGRLVASIALGPADDVDTDTRFPIASLTLLQAAFSHNGFSPDFPDSAGGFFHDVLAKNRVAGPILVTFSKQDVANGYAYPAASRLSRDDSSDFGGPGDKYGAIGRNGALHLDKVLAVSIVGTDLLPASADSGSYNFARNSINNLNGDEIITGHDDVTSPAIARAIAAVLR